MMATEGQRNEEILGVEHAQAARIWESHGEALSRLPHAQVREQVQEWMALLDASPRQADLVLALIEARLRDDPRPADTPIRRGRARLFKTVEEADGQETA